MPSVPNAPGPVLANEPDLTLPDLPGLATGSGITVAVPHMNVPAPPRPKVPKVLPAGDVTVTPESITMGRCSNGLSYCKYFTPF